jgi:CheY-like chemotaxis protein
MTSEHPPGAAAPSPLVDLLRRENVELKIRLRECIDDPAQPLEVARGEFLANISHELRTPLNGILGMLQILATTEMSAEQRDCVETALDSSRTLLWVLNDILEFTRVRCAGIEFSAKPFAPGEIAESVLQAFRHRATHKGLTLTCEVGANVPECLVGDGARLRQILFHLMGNAVKFTDKGSVRLEVQALPFGRTAERITLLFMVSDTGIGIPDDKLAGVFVPFIQADGTSSRRHQGLGLGLAVVRRIVKCMGGSAALESTPGQGTTVYMGLPFGLPVACPYPGPSGALRSDGLTSSDAARILRVLVVEDNTINRLVILRILRRLGHDPVGVARGADAVETLGAAAFDVIFMDIRMPGMDGLDTTRAIRSDRSGLFSADIPIVAVTANAMPGARQELLAQGFTDYLSKPMTIADVAETLERLFPGSAAACA